MSVPIEVIEQKALTLAEEAKALQIVDQKTYDRAAFKLRDVVTLRKEIEDHHGSIIKAIWDGYQTARKAAEAAQAKVLDPVAAAEKILKTAIAHYTDAQREIEFENRRQANLKAAQEAALRQKQEAEAAAAQAAVQIGNQLESALDNPDLSFEETQALMNQAQGIVKDVRDEVLQAPLRVEAPSVTPTLYRAKGISTPTEYLVEVRSMKELCAAVVDGRLADAFVLPNFPALKKLAGASKGKQEIPGCTVTTRTKVSARGR